MSTVVYHSSVVCRAGLAFFTVTLIAVGFLVLSGQLVIAQGGSNSTTNNILAVCDKTLIVETFREDKRYFSDWRIARHVNEEAYHEMKKEAGVDIPLFDVPVGVD